MKQEKRMMRDKKAYFFSLDAFIALLIILGVVLLIKPSIGQVSEQVSIQEDLLGVLSSIKVGELEGNTKTNYIQPWIVDGSITNLDQTVLEQIGEFYAKSDPKADILALSVLNDLNLDLNENVGLYFNGQEIAKVGSVDFSNAENAWTSRQIISGVQAGGAATGFSSRAFLFAENKVRYFYLGGYVGDGNITIDIGSNVISANVEADIGTDFDLYVNGGFVQSHSPVQGIPYNFSIAQGTFSSGSNTIEFRSNPLSTANVFIAGGFLKVVYNDSEVLVSENQKNFQGIDGLINIYDSFFVPGTLNSMEIFLHYNSSFNIFLTVGNTTVYNDNSSGSEASVTLTSAQLQTMLDYSELSNQTIPYRLGLEDASFVLGNATELDVFSVTDLSGSMLPDCSGAGFWCCVFSGDFCSSVNTCNSCGGVITENKIQSAKDANKVFIDSVLGSFLNQVGLVGYANDAPDIDYHALSTDGVSLKNKVDSWTASGATSICGGINKAVQKMDVEARENVSRSMVVMSDGKANVECIEQNTGSAKQDAIQAACDAFNIHNITVFAVGFGAGADEITLQSIASCGQGNYYFSDVDTLIQVYEQIAQDVINATFVEQTVIGEELKTKLFSDSYIFVDYDKQIPFGQLITTESSEFGNTISEGNFSIPNDAIPYEVGVISYSGSKWTDHVEVYNSSLGIWESVFNISEYGDDYIKIGDPFVVNIPTEKIINGTNLIRISAGVGPTNSSGGSPYDKVIFSLIKDISGFSGIHSSADGCSWNVEFEDGTSSVLTVPSGYVGPNICDYTSTSITTFFTDAINEAVYKLFLSLDLNGNGKIETKFSENDLSVSSTEVTGIPFTWETEVQVRVWR